MLKWQNGVSLRVINVGVLLAMHSGAFSVPYKSFSKVMVNVFHDGDNPQ